MCTPEVHLASRFSYVELCPNSITIFWPNLTKRRGTKELQQNLQVLKYKKCQMLRSLKKHARQFIYTNQWLLPTKVASDINFSDKSVV